MKYIKLLLLAALLQSCLKQSDTPVPPVTSIPYKGSDLVTTLEGESSLQLFNRAFKRVAMAANVHKDVGYTILAPVDSAMRAAGLDEATIDHLDADSLSRLIGFQILQGALDDHALAGVTSSVMVTLDAKLVYDPGGTSHYLTASTYIKEYQDVIYMNGFPVPKSKPVIAASNGYIYPVTAMAKRIKDGTLLDVIQNDPELSMYYQSLLIQDSLYGVGSFYGDPIIPILRDISPYQYMFPTVLAPTNKAFADAGFHTVDDIRNYATSTYSGMDPYGNWYYYFSPLDTVLNRHLLYNGIVAQLNNTGVVRIFYSDLLNPQFNNGKLNTYNDYIDPSFSLAIVYRQGLTFSANNGQAYVKYGNTSYLLPENGSNNFTNGTLLKINKLFYPINN